MKEAVIVAACRTAVGRAPRGILRQTRPEYMASTVVGEVVKRTPGLDPVEIDDVVLGCTFPEAEQGLNIGRVAAQKAGLPDEVPGMTVNRFCSSGLNAISIACERIMCGQAEVMIAGGVESMSLIPMGGNMMMLDPEMGLTKPWAYEGMGMTAENVANDFNISREDQDKLGVRSNDLALKAIAEGRFKDEIVPLMVTKQRKNKKGRYELYEEVFEVDEGPRPGTTMETLAKLRPAFVKGGSATAGNSSQMSDGAAAVMCMSKEKAKALGLTPMLTYRSFAVAGVDPRYMGVGPVKAIPKALALAGIGVDDLSLIELNEAFGSQAAYCLRELNLNLDITNVNGGAIALGHPLGCTGAKLTTQLAYEMGRREGSRWGLVSMCIGFGMGAAGVFEKENY
ncbi:MAG: thiolase family protein [Desulfarculaceae bacterium]|nr:thiolase family protein [Desulfarculaceae bacterium]MCF8046127.1 thiolase family protein [Desulfarculaceae bacterium]MCF8064236.1 thiolase family protein [Desulfarculaceae bacterium]MCF8097188.1 thiolase family protein [Desulfarculaceae bacterium]MCF8123241.1 thiolase family protein [Desulfarculaceae bacterium]